MRFIKGGACDEQFEKKTDHEDHSAYDSDSGGGNHAGAVFLDAVVFIQDPGRSVRVSADPVRRAAGVGKLYTDFQQV